MPANTGAAGASLRAAWFASKAGSYGAALERKRPPHHLNAAAFYLGVGAGLAGEHRHSRCQPPRRLVRQQAGSYGAALERKRPPHHLDAAAFYLGVGAGLPANTGAADASLRAAWFASKLAPTGLR